MLLIQIFEITAYDNRDELDGCAPVDGEQVDQSLERDALRCFEATELPRALLVIGPRHIEVGSQRSQQDVDEVGRGRYQVLAGALAQPHKIGRARTDNLQRLASGLRRIRRQTGGKCTEDIALGTHLELRTPGLEPIT